MTIGTVEVLNTNLVTAVVQAEVRTIPIVFIFVGDPIGSGFSPNFNAGPGDDGFQRKLSWILKFAMKERLSVISLQSATKPAHSRSCSTTSRKAGCGLLGIW